MNLVRVRKRGAGTGLGLAALSLVSIQAGFCAAAAQPWEYAFKQDGKGQPQAVYARILGEDGSHLWLVCSKYGAEGRDPALVSVTATVFQERFLGPSDLNGRSTVYWFDDSRPDVSRWMYRDRYGQISDATGVKAFIDRLRTSKKLVVELSNYRLETWASEFKLDPYDTRTTVERFDQDCRDLSDKQV